MLTEQKIREYLEYLKKFYRENSGDNAPEPINFIDWIEMEENK